MDFETSLSCEDIPRDYVDIVELSIGTRIKLEDREGIFKATLASLNNGELKLFSKKHTIRTYSLPYGNCKKLLHLPYWSSNHCENFVVALSYSNCVCVINLQSSAVTKSWTNIEDIHLRDELGLGYLQLVLHYKGSNVKSIVTPEFGWESQETALDDEEMAVETDTAVQSVVNALENQLKSACTELNNKQSQLLLRKALLNRSLASLSKMLTLQPSIARAPSFTIPVKSGPSEPKFDSKNDLDSKLCSRVNIISEMWQLVDLSTDSWIIGSSLENTSDTTLHNIKGILIVKNLSTTYSVRFYPENSKHSSNLSGFHEYFSGKLDKGERLNIAVVTAIPAFTSEESETATLFLTSNLSSHPNKIVQYNLGSCILRFEHLADGSKGFSHVIHKQPMFREHVYGLLSILNIKEDYLLKPEENQSLSPDAMGSITNKLSMHYNASLKCYYNFSFYGHAAITVHEQSEGAIRFSVSTRTTKDMRLFVRLLKNSTDRTSTSLTLAASELDIEVTPQKLLTSGLDLLSQGKLVEDEEPMEGTEESSSNETEFEKMRKAFLKRQRLLIEMSHGRGSHIAIPSDVYCKWLDQYFAQINTC